MKFHYPLITWFCKATWAVKYVISALAVGLRDQTSKMETYRESLPPLKSNDPLISWQIFTLNLHFRKTFG